MHDDSSIESVYRKGKLKQLNIYMLDCWALKEGAAIQLSVSGGMIRKDSLRSFLYIK